MIKPITLRIGLPLPLQPIKCGLLEILLAAPIVHPPILIPSDLRCLREGVLYSSGKRFIRCL